MDLYGRAWRVTVDTLQMEQQDVAFEIKRTLRPEPNTCDLKIYNLTADHRRQIEQNPALLALKKVPVKIEAGYGTTLSQIFLGELRAGTSVTDAADIVTELSTGDGEKALATARLNVSFGPGTSIDVVLREIISTLGIGTGNIQHAVTLLQAKGLVTFSARGVVLKGNAADHMTDFCKSAGLEWSIQDGGVQILTLGQPLQNQALKLTPDTGLVGSPSVDSKGVLTAQLLMIPGIRPGQLVVVDSAHVKGNYRIDTVKTTGDTLGQDWYHTISAVKF